MWAWLHRQTRRAGSAFLAVQEPLFHYVGAAANVFWGKQIRIPWISDFFASTGVTNTLWQLLACAIPPVVLQVPKRVFDRWRRSLMKAITAENAEERVRQFTNSWNTLLRNLDAAGEGVKMVNVLPFVITLLNVYADDLDEVGSIRENWVWPVYVAVSALSFMAFYVKQYELDCQADERMAGESVGALSEKWLHRQTRRVGKAFLAVQEPVFHYVGAAANVFWGKQIRIPWISDFFASTGVENTLWQLLACAIPPIVLQVPKRVFDHWRCDLVRTMTADNAEERVKQFTSSWNTLLRNLDATGEGVKMVNVLPFVITLLNVYSDDLDGVGSIRENWVWPVYVAVSALSFVAFYAKQYELDAQSDEKMAGELVNALSEKFEKSAEAIAESGESNAAAESHFPGLFSRVYRSASTNGQSEIEDPVALLQTLAKGAERAPLLGAVGA